MSRIGASLSGTERLLLNRLAEANTAATLNSLRLATGKKINSPAENPSGFVQLSGFEARLSVVKKTMEGVTAATSIVSQTQLALDQVRTQLDSIRALLLEDEDGSLTSDERAANQAEIDTLLTAMDALAGTAIHGKRTLDGSADFVISGRNASQVIDLQIISVAGATLHSGGEPAELSYQGSGGLITADANITVEGNLGSFTFDVATTDSLAEVAYQINQQETDTGATAEAVGDVLYIRSVGARGSDRVTVVANSGTFNVEGGNAEGTATGSSPGMASGPELSGTVEQAATQAQLIHDAGGATISADANLTLTGRRGSATIDVEAAENLTLDDFAQRINAQSHQTGILATIDGQNLELTSIDYGSRAEVSIEVNSGTFATEDTLGNAATTDGGTDAVATINGRRRSGNSSATAAALVHTTAAGVLTSDATLLITGPDGAETITIDIGVDDSLTGLRNAINAVSDDTGVMATIQGDDLIFSTGQTGAGSTLEVRVVAGTFAVDGGNGDGTAQGTEEVTGDTTVDGNRFTIVDGGLHAAIEFAGGFSGDFDAVSVQGGGLAFALTPEVGSLATLAIGGVQTYQLGGISGTLADLKTGGAAAGLDENTSLAIRIVDESLSQLSRIEGNVDGFAAAAIASAANLSSAMEENLTDTIDSINLVDENAESLLLAKNQALAANTLAAMSVLDQQRLRIVDLIQRIAGLTP